LTWVEWAVAPALFRIVQETLTNVARPAQATRVSVALRQDVDHVFVEVRDNGRGIRKGAAVGRKSLGLLGMRERARLLGGWVVVDGAPRRGTTITATIPLSQARPSTGVAADELCIAT
jgi:signal transduction histidine kinase